jgi:transcriptional regulator with XRE-family HTH domain
MGSPQTTATNLPRSPARQPRAADFDRRLGLAIRQRRIMLGLSQQQMAELIGVTYQQAHKYEKGINRISAARLSTICAGLGWTVADCLAGLDQQPRPPTTGERRMIKLAENLARLDERKTQAIMALVSALAEPEGSG